MIINLKKVLIFGIKDQIDVFFKAAQEQGFIEFFGSAKKIKKVSDTLKDYLSAIKILKRQPSQEQVEEKIPSQILIKNIIHLNESYEKFLEEERLIASEIARIAPFGDFALDDMHDLEKEIHRYIQFFTIKKSKREKLVIEDELIYINSAYELDYFIAINHERKTYPKMIEMFIEMPLKVLKEKKELLEEQIQNALHELKHLAKHLKYIQKELINELNIFNLDSAKLDTTSPIDQLFTIQGWVPDDKIDKLKLLTKNLHIDFVETQIGKTDKVPTYLENKKASKIGEDLIKIYDIPSTTDKDPSLWVLIFFAIFFAIIVSDAGYGLFYLGVGLILKYKIKNPKPVFARFIKLILILSTTTILWGAMIGSFFGKAPLPDSKYDKYSILNQLIYKKTKYHMHEKDDVYNDWVKKYPKTKFAKTPKDFLILTYNPKQGEQKFEAYEIFKGNILMELSLFIGVIHIIFSFLRYIKKNISGIGWIFFLVGGYLYLPSFEDATSFVNYFNILDKQSAAYFGKIIFFSGIGFAVTLALILKKLHGAEEITKSISIFSDVLSYLRLYALSLAGAITATTINNFAASANVVFAIILIMLGHCLNLLLSVMGGVIHGLRLNFIEWYHYSFEGDGKLFNPLKLLK